MKYDVTYGCGHSAVIDLWGKGKDRERKLKWCETALCPDCYKAEIYAKRKMKEQERGLKPLEGTPRQIAWAEKIREEFYDTFWAKCEKHKDAVEPQKEVIRKYQNYFASKKESGWWIEREIYLYSQFMREAKKIIL